MNNRWSLQSLSWEFRKGNDSGQKSNFNTPHETCWLIKCDFSYSMWPCICFPPHLQHSVIGFWKGASNTRKAFCSWWMSWYAHQVLSIHSYPYILLYTLRHPHYHTYTATYCHTHHTLTSLTHTHTQLLFYTPTLSHIPHTLNTHTFTSCVASLFESCNWSGQ